MMSSRERLTRAALLRRGAGAAAGIALLDALGSPARGASSTGTHTFVSRPDLRPPRVTVLRNDAATAPGLLFLAPSSGPGQRGGLIVDDSGEPVWFHPTTPATAMNLRAAVYRGKPVLTWWEGTTEHGLGVGTHVVMDDTYRVVERFPAGAGLASDLHELIVTPEGTALVAAWEIRNRDLRSVGGGSSRPVIGGVVQELELPSGRVLFQWNSLDHVALDESYATIGPRFDYFHLNAIDVASDGSLIVSARNTWTVYKIHRPSGRVLWRLGGRRSDFRMGRGTAFAWQHDAREHAGGRVLSLFDNGGAPWVQPQSKGLVLALDERRMRATLHRSYVHRPAAKAYKLGSCQLLPDGNVLVGWGTSPRFTEYSGAGKVLLDATLPRGGENYRTLRFPWVGRPSTSPRLVAHPAGGTSLYVSWNGATEVASWQLRTGSAPGSLSPASTVPRKGFETALTAPAGVAYAAVAALDRNGNVLGSSPAIKLGS
jgi:hypothetical protein